MCIQTNGTELKLPGALSLLSDNSISRVFLSSDGYVYKRSIPYLINNELAFLLAFKEHGGLAPEVELFDHITLKLSYLGAGQPITNPRVFGRRCRMQVDVLKDARIRHGDLTEKAVIVRDNTPWLIDFAESRWESDPALDKRPSPDSTKPQIWGNVGWMMITVKKMLIRCGHGEKIDVAMESFLHAS